MNPTSPIMNHLPSKFTMNTEQSLQLIDDLHVLTDSQIMDRYQLPIFRIWMARRQHSIAPPTSAPVWQQIAYKQSYEDSAKILSDNSLTLKYNLPIDQIRFINETLNLKPEIARLLDHEPFARDLQNLPLTRIAAKWVIDYNKLRWFTKKSGVIESPKENFLPPISFETDKKVLTTPQLVLKYSQFPERVVKRWLKTEPQHIRLSYNENLMAEIAKIKSEPRCLKGTTVAFRMNELADRLLISKALLEKTYQTYRARTQTPTQGKS